MITEEEWDEIEDKMFMEKGKNPEPYQVANRIIETLKTSPNKDFKAQSVSPKSSSLICYTQGCGKKRHNGYGYCEDCLKRKTS